MKKFTEKNLNEILNFQISYLADQNVRNGWTIKGLQVALVTLFWFFLQEVFDAKSDLKNVLAFFLLLNIFFELISNIDYLIKGSRLNVWEFKSFLIPSSKIEYLILILKYFAITVIATFLGSFIGFKFTDVLSAIAGVQIGELFFLYKLASFSPLKINQTFGRTEKIFRALIVLACGWIIIGFVNYLFSKNSGISLSDCKIGGILFLIVNVLVYVSRNQQTIFLDSLKKVKLDLAFGKISLKEGVAKAELFIFGSNYSHLLQEEISKIFISFEKYKIANNATVKFFKEFVGKSLEIKKMHPEELKLYRKKVGKEYEALRKIQKKSGRKFLKALKSFSSRSERLSRIVDEKEPNEILKIWKPVYRKLDNEMTKIEADRKETDKKMARFLPAAEN